MSNTVDRCQAQKLTSIPVKIAKNQAVSVAISFADAKPMLEGYPPPKRPNRTQPLDDGELRRELDAWEAASDEAFDQLEDELPE